MRIAFIDFETANKERNSICAVGVSIQEDGVETSNFYSLCKPEPFNISRFNNVVNSLDYYDLKNAPLFSTIYPELKSIVDSVDYVVSHNADFDMDCLSTYLYKHKIDFPDFIYICSCELAVLHFNDNNLIRLEDIATYFNITYNEHNALADAQTTGYVFWKMFKNKNIEDLKLFRFSDRFSIEKYQEVKDGICNVKPIKDVAMTIGNLPFVEIDALEIDATNFVITGSFVHARRKDIEEYIKKNGGNIQGNANKKTDYIIIGSMASDGWSNRNYGRKIEAALQIESITFISEETFLKLTSNLSKKIVLKSKDLKILETSTKMIFDF